MRIRNARPEDIPAIARVNVESWQSTYRGIMPDAYLDGLTTDRPEGNLRRLLAGERPGVFALAAEDEAGEVVGFAVGGPCRDAEPGYAGELYGIYLLSRAQRQGLGRALVTGVARRLADRGITSMLVWALEANAPARRFYEALGGVYLRKRLIELAGLALPEVSYGWLDTASLRTAPIDPSK